MPFCISPEIQHLYQKCSFKQPPHRRQQAAIAVLPEGKKTSVHTELQDPLARNTANKYNYCSLSAHSLTLEELSGKSSDERGEEAMLKRGSSTNLVKMWLL